MIGRMFRRTGRDDEVHKNAIAALKLLDRAILSVHPERFDDKMDAALSIQPELVTINTLLSRLETERFFAIEYEALLSKIAFFAEKGILPDLLQAVQAIPVADALVLGASHEIAIRFEKAVHDRNNLGREVQSSMQTLIGFLNSAASLQPEKAPSGSM